MLSEDELKTMDEKIGYCKYGMYTDDILELLRQEMEQEKNWEQYSKGKVRTSAFQYKLDFIFKHLKNNQLEQDEMEIFEISKYYKMLYYRLFTKEERDENFLNTIDIVINKNGKKEKSILYEIQREQGNLYYIYSHEEKTFIEITKEEIIDLQEKRILHYENFIRPDFEDQEGYR